MGTILQLRLASFAVLVASALLLGSAPAQAGPASPGRDAGRPAASPHANYIVTELDSLSSAAEDIYSLAEAGKLDRAAKRLDLLKKDAAAFDYVEDEASLMLLPRLSRAVADLDKSLAARNRLDTMRFANRITLIAATVAVPFKPRVPTEVALLDYNGRELEIWSEVRSNDKRTDKLSGIVIRMHLAWQTLMPKLIEQNGTKELRRFSDVMGRLELARVPEEYGRLARQALAESEGIKAVFTKAK